MAYVNFKTGALVEVVKQGFEQLVFNFNRHRTFAADQMMMIVRRRLIYQPPVADVRYQRQPVARQKVERTVNGCLSQTGHALYGALIDGQRCKMPAVLLDDLQNRQALGCQPEPAPAQIFNGLFRKGTFHKLIATSCISHCFLVIVLWNYTLFTPLLQYPNG